MRSARIWKMSGSSSFIALLLAVSAGVLAAVLISNDMIIQGLVVNELMARNLSGKRDQNGDYADWFEIKNNSAAAVNIGGFYVTDTGDNLTKWRFPPR